MRRGLDYCARSACGYRRAQNSLNLRRARGRGVRGVGGYQPSYTGSDRRHKAWNHSRAVENGMGHHSGGRLAVGASDPDEREFGSRKPFHGGGHPGERSGR